MADQNSSQAVTVNDAIEQIKKWAAEKNYEQVKQGCEEILQVEPDNKDAKDLLEEANKALNPQPAAPAPATMPSPAPAPAVPTAATFPVPAPAPQTAAPAQASPEDIFKKTTESTKTTTINSVNVETVKEDKKDPSETNRSIPKIITVGVFLVLTGGFIYSFMQGWLNPFYDWILGLFGL